MVSIGEKKATFRAGRGRAWPATFSADLCSDVHVDSQRNANSGGDVVPRHSLCESKLHVRDLDRSSSSRPRLQQPAQRLRARPRPVSLTDECKGLKQQIGSQSQALQEVRIELKESVEYALSEKRAHTRAESELDTLEQQVVDERVRTDTILTELESSRRFSAKMQQRYAAESSEWSAERCDLLHALSQAKHEKECTDVALQEESAALAQSSLVRSNLQSDLKELSGQLRQAELRYKASQECWEQRMVDLTVQASRDQEAAAFEWATEKQARLLAKEDSLKLIKELKEELNEETFQNRAGAWRNAGSKVELACQVKMLSEERDSLRLQLSELRRKAAEDYTQLLYFNRVQ